MAPKAAILAPVPAQHIINALATGMAKVAFGSNNVPFFLEQTLEPDGMPIQKWGNDKQVFIWATRLFAGAPSYIMGLCATGQYAGAEMANRFGRHTDEGLYRPPSTLTDTAWTIFWHVTNLRILPKDDSIRDQLRWGRKKLQNWRSPEGPVEIKVLATRSDTI